LELEGVPTTRALAMDILRDDEFASGTYTTGFLQDARRRLPALAQRVA
jgi:biotin carboxylase